MLRLSVFVVAVALLTLACDGSSNSPAAAEATNPAQPGDDGAPPPRSDAGEDAPEATALTCRYTHPFAGSEECKHYSGRGWDEPSARADCDNVFPGVTLMGDFSLTPCDTAAAIGVCTMDAGTDMETQSWLASGEPSVAENGCENFGGGQWTANQDYEEAEPQGELMPEALEALRSDAEVAVSAFCEDYECVKQMAEAGQWFEFTKAGQQPTRGVILYPGGLVDPRAYAPVARDIAAAGYLVALVPVPGLLAFNGTDRVPTIQQAHPNIEHWVLGGHSLGGAVAMRHAYEEGGVHGVLAYASLPTSQFDLSHTDLPIAVLYGSEERLATSPDLASSPQFAPPDAEYFVIEGGSHSQFGYYGNPRGESPSIDHAAQKAQIRTFTLPFLERAFARAEVRSARYRTAREMDDTLCLQTQRAVAGLTEAALPDSEIHTAWYDSESDFSSGKATVDASSSPQLLLHGYRQPHADAGRWAPDSLALEVRCKMRSQDRLEIALGIELDGDEGDCRTRNEATLAWARALLDVRESQRYEQGGMKLVPGADIAAEFGGMWLPQRPALQASADGTQCTLQAPGLHIPAEGDGAPDDLVGVHYCKLLSHSQALYWVTVQSFIKDRVQACTLPEPPTCPDPDNTASGSCIFYFAVAGQSFCEEYSGPAWTTDTAETKCSERDGHFAPVACQDRPEDTAGLDGDGEYRGACIVVCGEEERTWKMYSDPSGEGNVADSCPAGFVPPE